MWVDISKHQAHIWKYFIKQYIYVSKTSFTTWLYFTSPQLRGIFGLLGHHNAIILYNRQI